MSRGAHDDDRGVVFACGRCGAEISCVEEHHEEMLVLCPACGVDVTREFRRAYFAGVSASIHARLVERDNAAFLRYLRGAWRDTNAG